MVGRPLIRSRTKVNNIEVQDVMVGDEGTKIQKNIFCFAILIFFSTKSSTNA
jgi:hypothetical protein